MKALARRTGTGLYTHELEIRQHRLIADEPREVDGDDRGPNPQELLAASLAACMAITIEMYARRKGWDVGLAEVECVYTQAERGAPTQFELTLRLPRSLSEEQRHRVQAIAAKCPVHRTLEGEVSFTERVELIEA